MSDDYYYYKDQVKELQNVNEFVRKSTLYSVINKLEWIKEERSKSGLSNAGIDYAIEAVKAMV
jgi:hypothetical protein